jgi:hypothetical protein
MAEPGEGKRDSMPMEEREGWVFLQEENLRNGRLLEQSAELLAEIQVLIAI